MKGPKHTQSYFSTVQTGLWFVVIKLIILVTVDWFLRVRHGRKRDHTAKKYI